jgi:hypothetical protein
MPPKRILEKGQRFGRLTVTEISKSNRNKVFWLCLCDCGNQKFIQSQQLTSGKTKSCGCYRKDVSRKNNTTHGESKKTKEYQTWISMKNRCLNPKDASYKKYGARGITVCKKWKNSYQNFLKDMGRAPTKFHSIDRIDSSKNYYPKNCRWATRKQQAQNTKRNYTITYNNETLCLSEWARRLEINPSTLRYRLKNWSIKKALTTQKSF